MTAKERPGQTNSGQDEEKSEEFKNFERGIEHMLSLTPEEAKKVRDRTPAPKRKRKTRRK